MKALLREPLLHFVVLGAAIFALFAAFDDTPPPAPADMLEVTQADAVRLATRFEATWRRPPTPEELGNLIDGFVAEEVLVREATILGLDRDDAVVRQRLAQKMRFLIESGADAARPTDTDLQAHLEANSDRFARPPRLAFEQMPLAGSVGEADTILAALRAGEAPDTLGQPGLLPRDVPPNPPSAIDGTFGTGFFERIAALPEGAWVGPVESAYGPHLVRVTAVEAGRLPPLDEIREAVERDLRAETREALSDQRLEALMARYEIVRPYPAAVLAQ